MLINAFAHDSINSLCRRALNVSRENALYLLIDGAFKSGIHRSFHDDEKRILFDCLPGCNDNTRDVSPFLVRFDTSDQRFRIFLGHCSGWPMISAIETAENLDSFATRLARWCVIEAEGQFFNFRFADTRRISAIHKNLTKRQWANLAGPTISWSFIDRDGVWKDLKLVAEYFESETINFSPLLQTLQFTELVDDSYADEILAIIEYRGEKSQCLPSTRWETVVAALKIAKAAELGESDTVEWAIKCVQDHGKENSSGVEDKLRQWLDESSVARVAGDFI